MKSKLHAALLSTFIALGAAATADVCLAAPAVVAPARRQQAVVTGKVVMPDGQPAAEARVVVTRYDPDDHALVSTATGQVGRGGAGRFRISEDLRPLNAAVARGEAVTGTLVAYAPGLIGFGFPGQATAVKLIPTTTVRVRVVDSGGKPLAGVVLAPWYAYYQDANASDYNFVFLPPDLTARMRRRTDAGGWATFTGLPQHYEARLYVADLRFAQLGNPSDFPLAGASRTPDAAVTLKPAGVINGQAVFAGAAHRPAANVPILVSMQGGDNHQAVTDSQGRFHVGQLAQGSYDVVANLGFTKLADDWTAPALTGRYVQPGHPTNVGTMRLEHGGLLTVRVTDIATGAPLSGIPIAVAGPSNADGAGNFQSYSTNSIGVYRVHVPAGSQRVYTAVSGAQDSETVVIADGESKFINFKLVSQNSALLTGTVVNFAGKPVTGATVTVFQDFGDDAVTSGADGKFSFAQPMSDVNLAAQKGTAATHGLQLVHVTAKPIMVQLAPSAASGAISGTVVNTAGAAMPRAGVTLILWAGSSGANFIKAQTDDAGRYRFNDCFSSVRYSVMAENPGYTYAYSDDATLKPTEARIFPPIKLVRADSFVAGHVLDPGGKPYPGATITYDFVTGATTQTDARGYFRLNGVPGGKLRLMVDVARSGILNTGYDALAGHGDNVIYLESEPRREQQGGYYDARLIPGAKPFPFHATDLSGDSISLNNYKGKVLVLDFWATWCGPCVGEMPNVIATYNALHKNGLEVVGVSLDTDKARLLNYIKANDVPYPQIYDGKQFGESVAKAYGVQAIPFCLVIGRNGRIVAANVRGLALESAVSAALAAR